MDIKGYKGHWFSAEEITDILNGKKNKYYREPDQPPHKQYKVETVKNKLLQIEKNKLSNNEKNKIASYPQYGPKLTKFIPNSKKIGRPMKVYSQVYVDIILTITANKRIQNIDTEIANAILSATLKPSEVDTLIQNKLGQQTYKSIKKNEYYESFRKAIYNKQRRLKNAVLNAKKRYIDTYVTPLKENINMLDKKNELLRQIAFNDQISPELKTNILKFATTHTYKATKQYMNLLNKDLY